MEEMRARQMALGIGAAAFFDIHQIMTAVADDPVGAIEMRGELLGRYQQGIQGDASSANIVGHDTAFAPEKRAAKAALFPKPRKTPYTV
jgi:hypothetical protein